MAEDEDRRAEDDGAAEGHHDLVAQPHSEDEGPVAEAEILAAEMSSDEQPLGSRGRRFDRRSPFYIGLTASAGVAVTYAAVRVLGSLSSILVLIGVAFFLALGLEPAASWFVNRRLPRWAATTLVFVLFLAVIGAFVAAAIPPLVQQASSWSTRPRNTLNRRRTTPPSSAGSTRFHLKQRITDTMNSSGGSVFKEVFSAGTAVFGAVTDSLMVIVLTVYFLVDMPRIRTTLYRLIPIRVGRAPS